MANKRTFGLLAGSLASALALSGCAATRGGQDISCPRFSEYVEELETIGFVADIQCEADGQNCADGKGADKLLLGQAEDSLSKAIRLSVSGDREALGPPGRNHLLLSGGGQWGAYGAGMFAELHRRGKLDGLGVGHVTGVSTGGLQSLLLAVALDPKLDAARRDAAIKQLTDSYSPEDEKELVKRNGEELAVFTGSVAGTNPLRRHLFEVLCDKPDSCGLIQDLRNGTMETFIGFVEGRSGRFKFLSVRRVLKAETDDRAAASCIAAAAMASAAMPVFHQQMRVTGGSDDPTTLFDGGVRQSVFLAGIGERVERETNAAYSIRPKAAGAPATPQEEDYPEIYVVRNGPTIRTKDTKVDKVTTAAPQGKRAYDLIVNELEVGSIASLRLANPYGKIWLTTADGWDMKQASGEICKKEPKEAMFSPTFMKCLQRLGAGKVARDGGAWWPLRQIPRPPEASGGSE